MPIDHAGRPPGPPRKTSPFSSENPERGWKELNNEQPCQVCGEYFIQEYVVRRYDGREDPVIQFGPTSCRTGCAVDEATAPSFPI